MELESTEQMKEEIENLRNQGINAITVEDAIKDMSPEELERFLEERRRKFVNPQLDANMKELEKKKRHTQIKRIK